jgi:class 3 adenylate cyclase/TolB-like protein/tetratricopeptide (TPR) repeat protein
MITRLRSRSLATVLFTDIVDSTARATQLGDRGWHELLERHDALIRRELRRSGGRVVNTAGDAFLAVFERPANAIRCACAARDAVRALGMDIRCGVHMGELEWSGDAARGIAVHIGARVAARAGASEVLVSSTVRDAVEGSGFGFEDRGAHELKGVRGEWRLYSVTQVPAEEEPVAARLLPAATRRRTRLIGGLAFALLLVLVGVYIALKGNGDPSSNGEPPVGLAPAIAVLPFTVNDPSLERWREGMVDLLSTNLDGVVDLRAIDSRTVLARWKEAGGSVEVSDLETGLEVARQTGARYALLGSAASTGSDMRLTAVVHDAETGKTVGNGQVEGSPDSIFALVDGLSIEVLRTVSSARTPRVRVAEGTTTSLTALKAYLEGEALLRKSNFTQAIAAFERAVEADSTFALAFYRLATANGWTEIIESDVDRRHMERAARLAGRLAAREALLVRAKLAFWRGSLEGLDSLRQEVGRHPDDAEAWYLLGETSFHLGRQALAGQDENDRAFAKAIELDPSFTPAYVHLIENAFNYHADSARAARLVEAYSRLAPGSETSRLNRLALDLAFGDPRARKAAGAGLDSLPARSLMGIALHLWHPRFGPAQEEVLVAARDRGGPEATDATALLFLNGFLRGRLQAALALLDDPLMPGGYREAGFYVPYIARLGALLDQPVISSDRLDRELVLTEVDSFPYLGTFYSGAYAADRERWTEHARATRRLQEGAAHLLSKGDSTKARFTNGLALALEGHSLAKRERGEEAVRLLEAAQRQATAWAPLEVANATIRFWLSKLSQEAGEMREAERYAGSFWQDPLASFSLGQVYENLEKYDKARDAYEFFTASWRDADSDLQPLLEEGRRAAARLPSR